MHICKISKDFTAKKCCCIGNIDFVEGILQWCSWQASFKHPYSKICFSSYSMQSCEIYLFEHKMTSTSHSSTCVVDTSFNDAVDKLFQHTLTAHMLNGTFRLVIYTEYLFWIHWFYDLNYILKNMIFHPFALSLVEGILQWCNWRAVPAHPDSNLCYSSYYIYSCETYLSGKNFCL